MALTRAQLLAGNSSQGTVLPGQVQGVTAGPGVTIDAAGVLSLNGNDPAFNGFVKTNNASAFNAFIWPNADGSAGQQLTTNGSGTLSWSDPDGIAWTQKGQILAATGSGSANQTLVNVGTNGQILIADSATTSGLNYTSNYVATGGATTAALMPAGTTAQRPSAPTSGSLRYNSSLTSMEFYNGSSWEVVPSSTTGEFVEKTSSVGAALMPASTTANRPTSPQSGYTRYNSTLTSLEFYNGSSWEVVPSSATGFFVDETSAVGSAVMPAGTTAERDAAPQSGYTRYNSTLTSLEFYNGSGWGVVPYSDTGLFVEKTSTVGSAVMPAGTNAERDAAPDPGYLRFNTDISLLEFYDGTSWGELATSADFVTVTTTQTVTGAKTFTETLLVDKGTDNRVQIGRDGGSIELVRDTGAYIDFARLDTEDYNVRLDAFNAGSLTITNSTGNAALFVEGDIVAFVSDMRLKTNVEAIENALDKVNNLSGFTYTMNEKGQKLGYDGETRYPGVSAQEVQAVLPEAVRIAPASGALGEEHLTVQYEKLVPLLIEAIKELSNELNALKEKL